MTHNGFGATWEEDEMRGNVQLFVEGTLHIALFETWTLWSLWKHLEVTVTGRKSEGKVKGSVQLFSEEANQLKH